MSKKQIKSEWPIGRKIVDVRLMTKQEAVKEGWDRNSNLSPLLVLDDGSKIFPSQDDEGNGPGELFACTKRGKQIMLIFKEQP